MQVKERQKKKQPTKCIRIDAEGDATLEELEDIEKQENGQEPSEEPEKAKSSNKKVYMVQTKTHSSPFSLPVKCQVPNTFRTVCELV